MSQVTPYESLPPDQLIALSAQHYRAGEFDTALICCQLILQRDLQHAQAWSNASAALAALGRWVDALAYVRQALALQSGLGDAINNAAHILAQLGQPVEASSLLRNLGWALYQNKAVDEAMQTYERALAINPSDVDALHVLAGLHSERKNKSLALDLMNRALAIDPHHLNTLAAKGNLIGAELGRSEEAVMCFETALAIDPNHWMSLYNYGVHLAGAERYTQAVEMYTKATLADPNHHLPFWNLSNLLLRLGDYPRAWPLYEWRWKTDHLKPAYLALSMPLWTGQDLQDKRILLHFEQGYGDGFQFIRFAKNVAARGAHVSIFMPREICENFEGVAGVHHIYPWNEVPQNFDYHAPLMSLPAPLGLTLDNIPNAMPYMFAKADRLEKWQTLLPPLKARSKKKIKVGLAWCGRPTHDNDRNRSIAFADLLPLIKTFPQIEFVSTQVGPREADVPVLDSCKDITRIEHHISDFSDTAALMMQLDLLISVDTSVVHLAGALGKPVWVLIPAVSDWRWLQDKGDWQTTTPWYPNVRLFRQDAEAGRIWDWTGVLASIEQALHRLLA